MKQQLLDLGYRENFYSFYPSVNYFIHEMPPCYYLYSSALAHAIVAAAPIFNFKAEIMAGKLQGKPFLMKERLREINRTIEKRMDWEGFTDWEYYSIKEILSENPLSTLRMWAETQEDSMTWAILTDISPRNYVEFLLSHGAADCNIEWPIKIDTKGLTLKYLTALKTKLIVELTDYSYTHVADLTVYYSERIGNCAGFNQDTAYSYGPSNVLMKGGEAGIPSFLLPEDLEELYFSCVQTSVWEYKSHLQFRSDDLEQDQMFENSYSTLPFIYALIEKQELDTII